MSDIVQIDGNDSLSEVTTAKKDKITTTLGLPIVATYNVRSLFPKVGNFKTDILERNISVSFVSEIWQRSDKKEHSVEIEKMLEEDGLQYFSTTRKPNSRGVSYGGAALVVNLEKYSCEKLDVFTPQGVEAVWGLLKPKCGTAQFKKIIVCSFYSPPSKRKHSKMADHLVSTVHMLITKYPGSGIIMGADKNTMDIRPLLNCGLKLRQVVDKNTRQNKILSIIVMNTFQFYNSPIIVPPIGPDDPHNGKPSDHSVPVCAPHTDRYSRPIRGYRLQKYQPLPDNGVAKFGEWIMREDWASISDSVSPTEQVAQFEFLTLKKLNEFCPEKSIKLSSQDKFWMDSELKNIHRKKSREYEKRGKSEKYLELSKLFKRKYKSAAQKYMKKNVQDLKDSNPGKAFRTLKRMAAQPGDCSENGTFTLPNHEAEGLCAEQSAEKIAQHFADISQEFPPLNINLLPGHVRDKLHTAGSAPLIEDFEVFEKIKSAKKPKSGVPGISLLA